MIILRFSPWSWKFSKISGSSSFITFSLTISPPKSDITGLSRESPHCKAQHGKAKLFKKIRKESFRFRISLEKNQFELPVLHLHPFYSFQNFLNFWLTGPTMESIHFLVRHWIWTETHHLFKFIFAWTPKLNFSLIAVRLYQYFRNFI